MSLLRLLLNTVSTLFSLTVQARTKHEVAQAVRLAEIDSGPIKYFVGALSLSGDSRVGHMADGFPTYHDVFLLN